jgi:hypothetical protein
LFLAFYIASTIAVAELRTSLSADEVMRVGGLEAGRQVHEDSRQVSEGYPRYREAKKMSFTFEFRQGAAVLLDPPVTAEEFISAPIHFLLSFVIAATPSRSPPFSS